MIRNILKSITPPCIWTGVRACKRFVAGKFYVPSSAETEYRKNNAACSAGMFCLRSGINFKIHPDCRVGFEYFCYRSESMVAEMDSFLYITKGKKNFLDIGALHGVFSLAFAINNPTAKVVAVDASPLAFSRLLYNVHKNQLHGILPIECAASNESGVLCMHYEWEHLVATNSSSNEQLIAVQKKTGDVICEENIFPPDVIKIDVEGHEINVLNGLAKTIKKYRPIIFLEVHPQRIENCGQSLGDLVNIINQMNYGVFSMAGDNLPTDVLEDYKYDERFVLKCIL